MGGFLDKMSRGRSDRQERGASVARRGHLLQEVGDIGPATPCPCGPAVRTCTTTGAHPPGAGRDGQGPTRPGKVHPRQGQRRQPACQCLRGAGRAEATASELKEALADFDSALKASRNYPPAHRQKAEVLLQLGADGGSGRGRPSPDFRRGRPEAPALEQDVGVGLRVDLQTLQLDAGARPCAVFCTAQNAVQEKAPSKNVLRPRPLSSRGAWVRNSSSTSPASRNAVATAVPPGATGSEGDVPDDADHPAG
jgi:hypothetical protein